MGGFNLGGFPLGALFGQRPGPQMLPGQTPGIAGPLQQPQGALSQQAPQGGMPPGGMPSGGPVGNVLQSPMGILGANILAANQGRIGPPTGAGGRLGQALTSALPQMQQARMNQMRMQQAQQQMTIAQQQAQAAQEQQRREQDMRTQNRQEATRLITEYRNRAAEDGISARESAVLRRLERAELTGGMEDFNAALKALEEASEPMDRKTAEDAQGILRYMDTGEQVFAGDQAPQAQRPTAKDVNGVLRYLDTGEQVFPGVTANPPAQNMTDGQRKAAGFYSRMQDAEQLLSAIEGAEGFNPAPYMIPDFIADTTLGRLAMSPELQQYRNAAQEFIRAKLRKESGAVIGADEAREEYATYFPMRGDTPEVIAQKRVLRQNAMRAIAMEAGAAAEPTSDEWTIVE